MGRSGENTPYRNGQHAKPKMPTSWAGLGCYNVSARGCTSVNRCRASAKDASCAWAIHLRKLWAHVGFFFVKVFLQLIPDSTVVASFLDAKEQLSCTGSTRWQR